MNRRQFLKTTAIATSACVLPLSALRADPLLTEVPGIPNSFLNVEFYPTGHAALDKALGGGIRPNTYTLITGPAGSGKGRFLNKIYVNLKKMLFNLDGCFKEDPSAITIVNNKEELGIGLDYNPIEYEKHNISNELKLGKTIITTMQTHPRYDYATINNSKKMYYSYVHQAHNNWIDIYNAHLVILLDNDKITIVKNRYGKTGIVA